MYQESHTSKFQNHTWVMSHTCPNWNSYIYLFHGLYKIGIKQVWLNSLFWRLNTIMTKRAMKTQKTKNETSHWSPCYWQQVQVTQLWGVAGVASVARDAGECFQAISQARCPCQGPWEDFWVKEASWCLNVPAHLGRVTSGGPAS